MSVVGLMLTWQEFSKSVHKGDVFQFFAHGEGDYKQSDLHDLQGERLVVCDVAPGDPLEEVYDILFKKEGDTGAKWAFYKTNLRDRQAVYRILECQLQKLYSDLVMRM